MLHRSVNISHAREYLPDFGVTVLDSPELGPVMIYFAFSDFSEVEIALAYHFIGSQFIYLVIAHPGNFKLLFVALDTHGVFLDFHVALPHQLVCDHLHRVVLELVGHSP